MIRVLLLLIFLLVGCARPGSIPAKATSATVIIRGPLPAEGQEVYQDGRWWRIVKVGANHESSYGGRYCELELVKKE